MVVLKPLDAFVPCLSTQFCPNIVSAEFIAFIREVLKADWTKTNYQFTIYNRSFLNHF